MIFNPDEYVKKIKVKTMESSEVKKLETEEAHKNKGNDHFKKGEFSESIDLYTQAIDVNVEDPKKQTIYYYRRASAYFALGNSDKDAEERYKLVSRLHKAQLLADDISVQDNLDQIATNVNDIVVPDSYTGPKLAEDEEITKEWVLKLMDHMKNRKTLHKKYLWIILFKIKEILKALPTLVDVEVDMAKISSLLFIKPLPKDSFCNITSLGTSFDLFGKESQVSQNKIFNFRLILTYGNSISNLHNLHIPLGSMLYFRKLVKEDRPTRIKLVRSSSSNPSNHCMIGLKGPIYLGLYADQEQVWSLVVYFPSPNVKPWSYILKINQCGVKRPPRERPERCIGKPQIRAHKTQKTVEPISVGNPARSDPPSLTSEETTGTYATRVLESGCERDHCVLLLRSEGSREYMPHAKLRVRDHSHPKRGTRFPSAHSSNSSPTSQLNPPRSLKLREKCCKNLSQGFKNKEDKNSDLFLNIGEIHYRGGGKNNAQEESEIQKGIRLLREEIINLNEPLWIQDITMDGNCLYRAIADQLENDQNLYEKYKILALESLNDNKKIFENTCQHLCQVGIDEYLKKAQIDGEWGSELEIWALEFVINIECFIYNIIKSEKGEYSLRVVKLVNPLENELKKMRKKKNLSEDPFIITLGFVGNCHYVSIRQTNPENKDKDQIFEPNKKLVDTYKTQIERDFPQEVIQEFI